MKKVVKLTESDLKIIIEKVINEAFGTTKPISDFGDGTYTLTKINVGKSATQEGNYFIKNGLDSVQISDTSLSVLQTLFTIQKLVLSRFLGSGF